MAPHHLIEIRNLNMTKSIKSDEIINQVLKQLEYFYSKNKEVKDSQSHGIDHAKNVHNHTKNAINCIEPKLPSITSMEIQLAALLHDVDDRKYFPKENKSVIKTDVLDEEDLISLHSNAYEILSTIKNGALPEKSINRILYMIKLVSCSENGNYVPPEIHNDSSYHLLIPRWADRLEAVGVIGVSRCYQYTIEKGKPLSSPASPRPQTVQEVWNYATPSRFEEYCNSGGGSSDDMISHYYDKLLHIAKPPKCIVRNEYLEKAADVGAKELLEVCIRFGRTGVVDQEYIRGLERNL